jgi:hypothetical protein
MIEEYKKRSVNQGDNILLFSHSQGNLFANRVYDVYFSTDPGGDMHYKYRFSNIQIATPADYVHPHTHDYITREDDDVISLVPGSLEPNIHGDFLSSDQCTDSHDQMHHTFVRSYLNCPQIYERIASAVRNFNNGKNGDGGDMPSGCTRREGQSEFDGVLMAMLLSAILYPILGRRRKGAVA